MARRRRKTTPHYLINIGLSLLVLGVFSMTGLQVAGNSSAATINPYGYADYCALESNTTVIYGWAADPNATSLTQPSVTINAGGRATTSATNRAGYRDAQINAWIDANRPGDPKPGTYGFRAAIAGLYKGTRNTITGTVLNEGAGSSVILNINNSGPTDGDAGKPFFAGNLIPEACLAVPPSTPAPPPPPNNPPQPPAPRPPSTGPVTTSPAPPTAVPDPSLGTVITGTLAAEVKVPVNNAALVRIKYGKNPLSLDLATPEQPVNGAEAIVLITGLEPSSGYAYQIVRTDRNNRITTSPTGDFETLGYVVALHFVDKQNRGLQGITAKISEKNEQKKSDDDGNVSFTDVNDGSHTVTYTYRGKEYNRVVTASSSIVSPSEAAAAKVITLDFTINVEEAVAGQAKAPEPNEDGSGLLVTLIVGGIAAALIVFFTFIRRRRKQNMDYYYDDAPAPPLPEYKPLTPVPSEPVVSHPRGAEHMGESLKDMVLRSMAEEARRREQDGKK